MSDSTYNAEEWLKNHSADRDRWFDPSRPKTGDFDGPMYRMISAKQAIHKCVIESSWNEGDAVPGFPIPEGCEYAKATIRDARVHPLTGELQVVFDIQLLFADRGHLATFVGWR